MEEVVQGIKYRLGFEDPQKFRIEHCSTGPMEHALRARKRTMERLWAGWGSSEG